MVKKASNPRPPLPPHFSLIGETYKDENGIWRGVWPPPPKISDLKYEIVSHETGKRKPKFSLRRVFDA